MKVRSLRGDGSFLTGDIGIRLECVWQEGERNNLDGMGWICYVFWAEFAISVVDQVQSSCMGFPPNFSTTTMLNLRTLADTDGPYYQHYESMEES
jgi:hypothetical protein